MKTWYVLAVQAGKEKNVRQRVIERLQKYKRAVSGLEIIAPEEEVIVRSGNESERKRRMSLPGYLLLRSRPIPDESLVVISQAPGVIGFLGGNENPSPVPEREVLAILGTGGEVQQRRESIFSEGDEVTIVEGPLADFSGQIVELFLDKGEARVEIEIFGRSTPSTVSLHSLRPV